MLLSVNFCDKTLIFGVWIPYIQRQLVLSGRVTNMNFAFLGTPYSRAILGGTMSTNSKCCSTWFHTII